MSLLDKIIGTEEPKVRAHQFMMSYDLYKRGSITRAQLETEYGLVTDDPDITYLDTQHGNVSISGIGTALQDAAFQKISRYIFRQHVEGLWLLAERGHHGLDTKATLKTEIEAIVTGLSYP